MKPNDPEALDVELPSAPPTAEVPADVISAGGVGHRAFRAMFACILAAQTFICFLGLGDFWARGHNGWNGSAYHLSARNAFRWDLLFPLQYYTGRTPPSPSAVYTHHPPAMHLHNAGSLWLFGDSEAAIRLVPAIHGVLAVAALVLVVRRFYGPAVALLAGAVYVALPVNGIYANMMNHSSGFIFWSLIAFYCYLRLDEARSAAGTGEGGRVRPWGRWYAGFFAAFFMAALWDWPAYYLAFFIALHWFTVGLARHVRAGGRVWTLGPHVGLLVPYCAYVLALFGGHFLLVRLMVGTTEELAGTFDERRDIPWERFKAHLEVVPELMFTNIVLAICAIWLLVAAWRIARGRFPARDIIPLSFGVGGIIHYLVFRWPAIVHSYWAWTMLPFVAIACATAVVWLSGHARRMAVRTHTGSGGGGRRGLAAVAAALPLLLLAPLAARAIDLVPDGRSVAGSLWFVRPVRGAVTEGYASGRPELRFADQVRQWTDRSTGVLVHRSIAMLNPEPRFDITLDRELHHVANAARVGPERLGVDGWVFIGRVGRLPERTIVRYAADHPYYQFGEFFMVDLRRAEQDVRIWEIEPRAMTLTHWFWRSPFEGPVEAVRDSAAEEAMMHDVAAAREAP